ncbi:hypothetical protein CCAND95_10097 [Capnocytophaga canis]|uniref:Uncharacterized protein n=1 Tax=Capnocytophaga canis TaxID=1848903 RepID=A0A0B7HXB1_9FLAO|nr:hypothetical protein CCAND95_10097 [Capnocytophaga canis]CEN43189.1 hypothetical protein CCAND38_10093 [Capnocytophaga canis]CEN53266.1 hypothetical protein CCAND93_40050 [Capnocytophaga canis]
MVLTFLFGHFYYIYSIKVKEFNIFKIYTLFFLILNFSFLNEMF